MKTVIEIVPDNSDAIDEFEMKRRLIGGDRREIVIMADEIPAKDNSVGRSGVKDREVERFEFVPFDEERVFAAAVIKPTR